jgi:hypothetical protein
MDKTNSTYEEWLAAVATALGRVRIDGALVPASSHWLDVCLGDEPTDMYEAGLTAQEYAAQAEEEYGVVNNDEI